MDLFGPLLLLLPLIAVVLFINEMMYIIGVKSSAQIKKISHQTMIVVTNILGIAFSALLFTGAGYHDWQEVIDELQSYSFLFLNDAPRYLFLAVLACLSFIVVFLRRFRLPPLVFFILMIFIYLGVFQSGSLLVQLSGGHGVEVFFFCLYPVLYIAQTMRLVVNLYQELDFSQFEGKSSFIFVILRKHQVVGKLGFILFLPLLGLLLAVVILFYQQPDKLLRVYTETSEWGLSQRISPPKVDAHYLCTVAAGGSSKLVKPQRKGVRHGQAIIVNRQLCIANAYEDLLNEKMSRLHRLIRKFYDHYGYPLACKITTKPRANFVYICMKPLEWFFLVSLYLVDIHPENRIAVQYTPLKRKER